MTPEKKQSLREKAAQLKRDAARARIERARSKKRFDEAVATLRELSGRI